MCSILYLFDSILFVVLVLPKSLIFVFCILLNNIPLPIDVIYSFCSHYHLHIMRVLNVFFCPNLLEHTASLCLILTFFLTFSTPLYIFIISPLFFVLLHNFCVYRFTFQPRLYFTCWFVYGIILL